MRSFIFICTFTMILTSMAPTGFGQDKTGAEDKGKNEANQQAAKNAKLSKEDIATFEPMLFKYLDAPPNEKTGPMDAILEAMKTYAETKKVSSPVADAQAWLDMFARYNAASFKKRKVYGTGRIKTEEFVLSGKGEHIVYEYSIFVPKSYTPEKSWPVLLCLHDKNAKKLGQGYIKKVWQGSKEMKALCENFIIIVPHIPKKLPRKKVKIKRGKKSVSVKTTSKRIEWFNNFHMRAMLLPLYELRKQYNCDPTRIFIEGVGAGADAAVTLAAMTPGRFAGVIVRHGRLRDPRLLTGLQHTPAMFIMRKDGDFAHGEGKDFWDLLETAEKGETKYDALQLERFPSLGKKKPSLSMLANQSTDPVLEANAKIVEFIGKYQTDPHPKEIRITSNNRTFRSHPLLKVTEHDIAEGELLDCIAKFDREKNTVELTGKNFYGVSLFLNDLVLDLSKPIQVLVNGRQVDARVPDRSPSRMLKTIDRAKTDFHRIMTSLIVVPRFTLEPKKNATEKAEDSKKEKAAK